MLESGPAKATIGSAHFLFLELEGLIGTGFAQPNTNPDPDIIKSSGTMTDPVKSRCLMGFKVSRP